MDDRSTTSTTLLARARAADRRGRPAQRPRHRRAARRRQVDAGAPRRRTRSATAPCSCGWTASTSRSRSWCGSAGAIAWARPTRSTPPATSRCSRACARARTTSSTRPSSGARSRSRSPARSPSRASVPLVVTEGNYLLVDDGDWARVRPLLDEAWYVEMDEETRLELADPAPHRVRQDARRSPRLGDALRPGQRRGQRGDPRARRRHRPARHARADRVAGASA